MTMIITTLIVYNVHAEQDHHLMNNAHHGYDYHDLHRNDNYDHGLNQLVAPPVKARTREVTLKDAHTV